MADSKEETGKGANRPYATIDLKATEVGAEADPKPAPGAKTTPRSVPNPWAAALASIRGQQAMPFLTHVGAGLTGGLLAVLAGLLLAGLADGERGGPPQVAALAGRVSELERTASGQSQLPELRNRVDALARSNSMLDAASGKQAAELKALEERLGNAGVPELGERLAKLESALAALSVAGAGGTSEAVRSGLDRFERQVAGAKADASRLAERLDHFEQQLRAAQTGLEGVKADLDRGLRATARAEDLAPLAGRMSALDKELQAFLKTEADRTANTSRVVLSLELSNLKRAIERGDSFVTELAAAKKVAGDRLNLTLFDRYAAEGLPPLSELTTSFRKVANGMLDAEAEPADAPLLQRLLSGARSIVRVRKSGQAADDGSLEATIARMETALKENRLADLLAQSKKLPPKAALIAEDWLRRVEMRYQVEKALADTEAALKSSLAAGPASPDRRQ